MFSVCDQNKYKNRHLIAEYQRMEVSCCRWNGRKVASWEGEGRRAGCRHLSREEDLLGGYPMSSDTECLDLIQGVSVKFVDKLHIRQRKTFI
jgi:hypothetical protein